MVVVGGCQTKVSSEQTLCTVLSATKEKGLMKWWEEAQDGDTDKMHVHFLELISAHCLNC